MKCSEKLEQYNADGHQLYLNGIDIQVNDSLLVLITATEHVAENETIEHMPLKSALEDLQAVLGAQP